MATFFLDPSGRLRTVWRFLIFGIGFLLVQIAVGVGIVAVVLVYTLALGKPFEGLSGAANALGDGSLAIQILAAGPMTAASFGLVWVCRRFLDRRPLKTLGFVRPGPNFFESVVGGLVLGTLPLVFCAGLLLVTGHYTFQGVSVSLQTALLVPTFIVMAFNEEIVCRGYLLQNLMDIERPWFGIWFSSLVFWLLHGMNPAAWSSPIVSLNLF
ncbi:MAG: hypothetical protein JSS02_16515, partial [Planctomycetes bacterium]|nr:hypothetical protein [Planctomycetota bacterium]